MAWEAGTFNDTHTHDFGAAVLVLEGEISITCEDGSKTTCRPDTFALDAGIPHSEQVGPDGQDGSEDDIGNWQKP